MDSRRNMLIGIVAGIVIVGALSYATGLTKLIRSSFGSSTEYTGSESAAAPELAAGEWINSAPLKLNELRGRVVLPGFRTDLPLVRFVEVLRDVGCAMTGQTAEIAPLDRRLYDLRSASGTVRSLPLIASSIMSNFARRVNGNVSVGLRAVEPVKATKR